MKYVIADSFRGDYQRLSVAERERFRQALGTFVPACDRFAADPSVAWPSSLRVKDVKSAPGVWEMTWSFAGPDGRATFEWIEIDGQPAIRWRRIGGHRILKQA